MASTIRKIVIEKLGAVLRPSSASSASTEDFLQRLAWCIRVKQPEQKQAAPVHVHIPLNLLKVAGVTPGLTPEQQQALAAEVGQHSASLSGVKVTQGERRLEVRLPDTEVVKAVLSDISKTRPLSDLCRDLTRFPHPGGVTQIEREEQPPHVLIEYSSPNIAKPFHAGHLRSTVQGNVLANLLEYTGHKVTRVNYLGDWGTQFGYIGVGLDRYASQIDPEDSAISQYYQVYVQANQESVEKPEIHQQAMQFFHRMEQGGQKELSVWKACRDASLEEYQQMYERLGVRFDVCEGESMFKERALSVVETLREKGLAATDMETGVTSLEIQSPVQQKVKLLKSDGGTLYLTRDMAAAIHRQEKYAFNRLLYVVSDAQNKHFSSLLSCLQVMGEHTEPSDWLGGVKPSDWLGGVKHVRFGLVQGMSSRKGEVVFLKDVLNRARDTMLQVMKDTSTTKLTDPADLWRAADQLGVSAIVVQDLCHPRTRPYTFNWDRMLTFTGNTGVFIQYTHARLCGLARTCAERGVDLDLGCDTSCLCEPQALHLALSLAGFDGALYSACNGLEPFRLVHYLLEVCHSTGSAFHSLQVLNQPQYVAQARLLLFHCARLIIAEGLQLLSLTPLERM